jgi:hypothetical protein
MLKDLPRARGAWGAATVGRDPARAPRQQWATVGARAGAATGTPTGDEANLGGGRHGHEKRIEEGIKLLFFHLPVGIAGK